MTGAKEGTKKENANQSTGCLSCLIVILVAGGLFYWVNTIEVVPQKNHLTLEADVSVLLGTVTIQNNDEYDYNSSRLRINGITLQEGGAYEYKMDEPIAAGESVTLLSTEFKNGLGKGFNPLTSKIRTVSISCTVTTEEHGECTAGNVFYIKSMI